MDEAHRKGERGWPVASVIILNHNYQTFLPASIESALAQSFKSAEVVVVDDGSTDGSRSVIASYEGRVRPLLKCQGGQASGLNAGFRASRGQIVMFLDADDVLDRDALDRIVPLFARGVTKVHWPLRVVDADGKPTARLKPNSPLPAGDFRKLVFARGPEALQIVPTSGNAWARSFLDRVMPIPEAAFARSADKYLYELAPFFGPIAALETPASSYRVHGRNISRSRNLVDQVGGSRRLWEVCADAAARQAGRLGREVDRTAWAAHSSSLRMERVVRSIENLDGDGGVILVTDGSLGGGPINGRRMFHFVERDGRYHGPPRTDTEAIEALEQMRADGAQALIIPWLSFWWKDTYKAFLAYVDERFEALFDDEILLAYRL